MEYVTVTTDQDGRYLVAGLEPGDGYRFAIKTRDGSAAPDWVYQLPYIQKLHEEQAEGIVELPTANLLGSNHSLSGVVVDPDGQPVSGITVSASLKGGRSLARRDNGAQHWTETDQAGQFQLEQLTDEAIELMAYKRNPAGGTILFPARIEALRNQTDIRIVLDPRLAGPLEDLDNK